MRELIFLAILGGVLAVPRSGQQRIVGGESTTIESYPFAANMMTLYPQFEVWFPECGGSLISTRAVLSAAHCYQFPQDLPRQWRVRVGSTYTSFGGAIHDVERLFSHRYYNWPTPQVNDVAVVRLATEVTLSDSVRVARIAGPHYRLADGESLTVVGWGDLALGGPGAIDLQVVNVDVINQNICKERYAELKKEELYQDYPDVTDDMLCTGILDVGGKDSCQGDYGGPVTHDYDVIVGVSSWGYRCANEYYPGVNTRVSYFSDWIAQHAALFYDDRDDVI